MAETSVDFVAWFSDTLLGERMPPITELLVAHLTALREANKGCGQTCFAGEWKCGMAMVGVPWISFCNACLERRDQAIAVLTRTETLND